MAWRCPYNKPLSEPMVVSLPTHISVTRHQWVKLRKGSGREGVYFSQTAEKEVIVRVYSSLKQSQRLLTHWGRDKMAAVFQTTFSNGFSWMKSYEFRLKFHWKLFLGVQLTIFQHWLREWLGAGHATSHYQNQWWLVYWRKYACVLLRTNLGGNFIKYQNCPFNERQLKMPPVQWRPFCSDANAVVSFTK